jgi:hypothetical protein
MTGINFPTVGTESHCTKDSVHRKCSVLLSIGMVFFSSVLICCSCYWQILWTTQVLFVISGLLECITHFIPLDWMGCDTLHKILKAIFFIPKFIASESAHCMECF